MVSESFEKSLSAGEKPNYFVCTLGEAALFNIELLEQGQKTIAEASGASRDADSSVDRRYSSLSEFLGVLAHIHGDRWAVGCPRPDFSRAGSGSVDNSDLNNIYRKSTSTALSSTQHLDSRNVQETQRWTVDILSFNNVNELSRAVACWLAVEIGFPPSYTPPNDATSSGVTVGLLASSSLVFLVVWLGLLHCGYDVLLVAPQCSPEAIKHLLVSSSCIALCHDDRHKTAASRSVELAALHRSEPQIKKVCIPWNNVTEIVVETAHQLHNSMTTQRQKVGDDIAFYFHSSGTSGQPKLIPQTHFGAVGVLPRLFEKTPATSDRVGTFSSTPLYHGGISDLLRSWSAASPLWIFPENLMPITGQTVHRAILEVKISCREAEQAARLGYLSCVPYVLQMLAEEPGMKLVLRNMDMVGIGGAALPERLGDELVRDGVKLVSRYGSAECGFLLSSHRDFLEDKSWQYLRKARKVSSIYFEAQADNKSELVVTEKWPLRSPLIQSQLPFHTKDLFIRHPSQEDAWKYIGRSDTTITLLTGKKFDPSIIETSICEYIEFQESLVVGDNRPYPALLVFLSKKGERKNLEERQNAISRALVQANALVASHARISKPMTRIMSDCEAQRMPKSSKGTIQRKKAVEIFEVEIEQLYNSQETEDDATLGNSDAGYVREKIKAIVRGVLDRDDLADSANLFEEGVDSSASMQIEAKLKRRLSSEARARVLPNVVYQCGSIERLAAYISSLAGNPSPNGILEDNSQEEMILLTENFKSSQKTQLDQLLSQVKNPEVPTDQSTSNRPRILLTGATGFLGIHILDVLLETSEAEHIILPVRVRAGDSQKEQDASARNRIEEALAKNGLRQLDRAKSNSQGPAFTFKPLAPAKDNSEYPPLELLEIEPTFTHVIHAAWSVNFNLPLLSFSRQLQGVVDLYNLARLSRARSDGQSIDFVFCSSIASVANAKIAGDGTPEALSTEPGDASDLGYARSKWVAENILASFQADKSAKETSLNKETAVQPTSDSSKDIRVSILRIGQLCSDSRQGTWNMREAWPLMLDAGFKGLSKGESPEDRTGILPNLAKLGLEPPAWLPVDLAAKIVFEAAFRETENLNELSSSKNTQPEFLHVLNADYSKTWEDIQSWIAKAVQGRASAKERASEVIEVSFIPADDWLSRLEVLKEAHPAKALLGFWRSRWHHQQQDGHRSARFQTAIAENVSATMRDRPKMQLGLESVGKMIQWVLDGR